MAETSLISACSESVGSHPHIRRSELSGSRLLRYMLHALAYSEPTPAQVCHPVSGPSSVAGAESLGFRHLYLVTASEDGVQTVRIPQ